MKKKTLIMLESIDEIEQHLKKYELAYNHHEKILINHNYDIQLADFSVEYDPIEGVHDIIFSFGNFYFYKELIDDIIIKLEESEIF